MTKAIRKQLPRAKLISFEWSWAYFYFAKFRLANAARLQIGWLAVLIRAPWLERSARASHPHLFSSAALRDHQGE